VKIPVTNEAVRAEARKVHQARYRKAKQPLRIKGRMTLGGEQEPTGGWRRVIKPLPPRPSVISDGVEFEVVWYAHRDAPSLQQPTDFSPLRDSTQICGAEIVIVKCAVYAEDDE
jgi:hypothetical protein